MTDLDRLDEAVDRYHVALDAFFNGDPEPAKATFSHRDDVSLANPFGPPALGWRQVAETMTDAAAHYREGRARVRPTGTLAAAVALLRGHGRQSQDLAAGRRGRLSRLAHIDLTRPRVRTA